MNSSDKITYMKFVGDDMVNASIEAQNMVESILNLIGENRPNYILEVSIKISEEEPATSVCKTPRWAKCGKRPLSHKSKQGKKVVLYNKDTNFWIMVNNIECPNEFKDFLKANENMFTHCMTLETAQISVKQLTDDFQRLHINYALKKTKKKFEEFVANVYEIRSFAKSL